MKKEITLDFGKFQFKAELFNTKIADEFYNNMPYSVKLTTWGNESYGSIGKNPGTENPVPEIPEGGIAYTNQGNYVCFFYGQTPAWAVEYIGYIDNWKEILGQKLNKVEIKK